MSKRERFVGHIPSKEEEELLRPFYLEVQANAEKAIFGRKPYYVPGCPHPIQPIDDKDKDPHHRKEPAYW